MKNQMASKAIKTLGVFVKPSIFNSPPGSKLPEAYKKFYNEWKFTQPTAVHYVPEVGTYRRDDVTGEVLPIQDVPIPLMYPKEHHQHIWGGEAIVQGFKSSRARWTRRVPHFWVPTLKRTVIYSTILDKYMSVIVTDRALHLINSNFGFDHYLLKTPACDLKSLLALGLKRKILQELEKGCPTYERDPTKREEILAEYKNYLNAYTSEEIEWYGYSYHQALKKLEENLKAEEQEKVTPLKHVFRKQLLEQLRTSSLQESSDSLDIGKTDSPSWIQKINPFGKKHET